MPMIDVYATEGTFSDKHTLAQDLANAVMRWEQVPRIPLFLDNTAAFIHDLPANAISNAAGDGNYVRVQVLTPINVLDRDKQLGVVEELTEIVVAAAGDPTLADRTWVLITESPERGWGIDGHANTRRRHRRRRTRCPRGQRAVIDPEGIRNTHDRAPGRRLRDTAVAPGDLAGRAGRSVLAALFIWHTAEDICVPPEHTYRLAAALAANNVAHAVHVVSHGPHSLGLAHVPRTSRSGRPWRRPGSHSRRPCQRAPEPRVTSTLGLPVRGMRWQVHRLVGTVVDPVVPSTERGATTVTPAEIIYHRRVRLLSLADELGNVAAACRRRHRASHIELRQCRTPVGAPQNAPRSEPEDLRRLRPLMPQQSPGLGGSVNVPET